MNPVSSLTDLFICAAAGITLICAIIFIADLVSMVRARSLLDPERSDER